MWLNVNNCSLYFMAFVSLLSLIIWIFRPCKLLWLSMHMHRLSMTYNYVGTTCNVGLAVTSRLKWWATPTSVYILHIANGQSSTLFCSVSKRCVPESVRVCAFVSNPEVAMKWEIYCAMTQEYNCLSLGSTLSATTESRKAWTWVVAVQGHYQLHDFS